jgi:hypothetical protein
MREELLTVVGGNFCFETPVQVRFRSDNVMAPTRDDRGYLLLDTTMLSSSGDPRMTI